jgi:ABC-type uncharacterized transport system permease subunit
MTRVLRTAGTLILASVLSATTAVAQSARFGLGGGLLVPTGDYNVVDKTGWHVLGKVDFAIPLSPVSVRVDGLYGQTTHRAAPGNTKLAGGTADAVWHIPTAVPGFKPYLLGGVGMFNVNAYGGSSTKFTWGGGAGTSIGVGPIHGFAEARYMSIQESGASLKFIPVTVGLAFGSK